jgi:hypothetical protein
VPAIGVSRRQLAGVCASQQAYKLPPVVVLYASHL